MNVSSMIQKCVSKGCHTYALCIIVLFFYKIFPKSMIFAEKFTGSRPVNNSL